MARVPESETKRKRAPVAARKEVLFRDVNERVLEASGDDPNGMIEILCECGDDACLDQIVVPVLDYEAVRSVPTRFIVAAGHENERIERIVESYGSYTIVEKLGEAANYARRVATPRA